ncbi:putative ion transporter superfamily protein YfcC [Pelomonas saccharophila]|uniref:Ion transporter superfamily protein YfcC n=1 Tax=Roseateles saccharophilus TaxID=304 RepID=A0ABU1YKC5_ROSSA|nr:YfcC family protein [Roseateles saccharophilus]MDR7269299.1 putative ion transporter superfamily protein YfcC [Roseateles saccharophilus]
MKLRLPNTYVLLFALLALIAAATWVVPGGRFQTELVNGKTLIVAGSFHLIDAKPQGLTALLTAPIKGFVEAALIIGFVLIVGGAFAVLQGTEAIDALIKSVARAHSRSALVRVAVIPVFVTLFSLGGASFGMAEEAIPFVLIFIPLALALKLDTLTGVAIPFVGSQVGFATAFLNPFNVGVAQGIAGVPMFSGLGYRALCWSIATTVTIAFLMWWAARIKRSPELSPTYAMDQERRKTLDLASFEAFTGMSGRHRAVLWLFAATLLVMIGGVVKFGWYIEEIAALFLVMAVAVGAVARLSADEFMAAFLHGARDLVGTALVIALAKGTVILMREGQIIDTLLNALAPLVASSTPVLAAQKMFAIQSVINFFIHSGTGQAALTMPIMAPLADLVGVTRQTAVLAFQFGELTTPIIPTSGITVGVLALARVPFGQWVRWMLPLQGLYLVMALALLAFPAMTGWVQ